MTDQPNSAQSQSIFQHEQVTIYLIVILLSLIFCTNAFSSENPCSNAIDVGNCMANQLSKDEAQLDVVYQERLKELPEVNQWDTRKTQDQLRRSQNAWRIYRDENCSYLGGTQGGSSKWVSVFVIECKVNETKNRIKFLKNLPTQQ